jgi:hypothetical protein
MSSISELSPASPQPITPPAASPLGEPGRLANTDLVQVQARGMPLSRESGAAAMINTAASSVSLSGRLSQVVDEFRSSSSLHDRGGPRLRDADSLIKLAGTKPKDDLLCGLWKMSKKYKAVTTGLTDYHQLLQRPISGDPAQARVEAGQRVDHLQLLNDKIETYLKAHPDNATSRAMQTLQRELLHEISEINNVASTAGRGGLGTEMSWTDALQGSNYRLLASVARNHDGQVDHTRSNEDFAGGAINKVAKLVYGTGAEARTVIFKPDPDRIDSREVCQQILRPMGIDPERPNFAARNVASAFASQTFGLNSSVHCELALHRGKIGMAMDLAAGRPPQGHVYIAVAGLPNRADHTEADFPAVMKEFTKDLILSYDEQPGGFFAQVDHPAFKDWLDGGRQGQGPAWDRLNQAIDSGQLDLSQVRDPDTDTPLYFQQGDLICTRQTVVRMPPSTQTAPGLDAQLQKGMNQLEWNDGFAAQRDRHSGNYLVAVDPVLGKVQVTGIDNDFSFGSEQTSVEKRFAGGFSIGLPALVDAQILAEYRSKDFERDLLPTLSVLLQPEEVAATRGRFEQLKAHAETLAEQGKVVENWLTWRSPEGQNARQFLVAAGTDNSYYARELDSAAATSRFASDPRWVD